MRTTATLLPARSGVAVALKRDPIALREANALRGSARFTQAVSASRYRPDLPEWLPLSLERAVAAQPAQRYETAEEWLRALEQADRRELSVRLRPLLEREPLKVWRTLALVSLLLNLVLLMVALH